MVSWPNDARRVNTAIPGRLCFMAVFTVVVNVVLVLAALVTVWFAARAAASGADATRLANESLVYSRETMQAVRAASEADGRERRQSSSVRSPARWRGSSGMRGSWLRRRALTGRSPGSVALSRAAL